MCSSEVSKRSRIVHFSVAFNGTVTRGVQLELGQMVSTSKCRGDTTLSVSDFQSIFARAMSGARGAIAGFVDGAQD